MVATTTEKLLENALSLDMRPCSDAAGLMADAQLIAASKVEAAIPVICDAASAMADTIDTGGRLHYVAAGSSGLMAAADALELGGTFSIPAHQVSILMAGGLPTGSNMPGDVEDNASGLPDTLPEDMKADCVIAVSASGTTPFTLAAAKITRERSAKVIGIANNAGAPLLALSDFPILLETPPEVLSGSTRMGAGTSQKIALNMLSTLMALKLGHIHDGMMVNLRADNEKLHRRAVSIVARIAGVADEDATAALNRTGGDVKCAVLCAKGATATHARALLDNTKGHLRPALHVLENEMKN